MKYALLLSKEVASAASFAYIKAAMGLRERKWLRDPRGAGIGRKREPGRPSKQFAVGLRERNCLRDPRRAGIGRKREPGRPSKQAFTGLRAVNCLRDPRRAVVQGKIRRKEGSRGSQEKKKSERPKGRVKRKTEEKKAAVGLRERKSLRDPRGAVVQGKNKRKEARRGSQGKKKSERPKESCSISSN